MQQIQSITIHALRSHGQITCNLGPRTLVTGANGIGKTNFLESLYLGINGILPPGRSLEQMITRDCDSGFVRLCWTSELPVDRETTVTLSRTPARSGFLSQGSTVSRPEYLRQHKKRAMLFTPIEMNILYLGPSLRRDFLDEALLLSHGEFARVRREYSLTLRSRNALLKRIDAGQSDPSELDSWDLLFTRLIVQYSHYRDLAIRVLRSQVLENLDSVRRGLSLTLVYTSKIPRDLSDTERETFIREYLRTNRDRDIRIGHATIGPHLDDFGYYLSADELSVDYLSRGENKTLLILSKLALARYVEQVSGAQMIYLLDDIAAELDTQHFEHIIFSCQDRMIVVSGHRVPQNMFDPGDSNIVDLNVLCKSQ